MLQTLLFNLEWGGLMFSIIFTRAFMYWNRRLKMNQDRSTKWVVEYQLINFNEHSWCGDLCNMLEELHKVDYIIDGKLVNLENIQEDLFDFIY